MPDIRHRIAVHAPIDEVYDAFATTTGIRSWWTTDVRGDSVTGSSLAFYFGQPEPAAVMEVAELRAPSRVRWHVIDGPDEWKGTDITFDLKEEDGQTIVRFTHQDWREPVDFLHHCSTKWALFLLGLKAAHEGGSATPWPDDPPVDNWG